MIVAKIIAFLYCLCLPGWLMAKLTLKKLDGAETFALGVGFGICLVPLTAFAAAMILGTNISYLLLVSVGSAFNLPLALLWLYQKRRGRL